jgi:transcription initiation factor TFIIIB Brf1 subunit/transcription initiation factor TFIIB
MNCSALGINDFKTWTTGEDTTQFQMGNAVGVTEITIRNRLKDLKINLS